MTDDVVIEPMTEGFIVWRCLHRGPLSKETIETPPAEGPDWEQRRAVNVPLLEKLIKTYGTCAMLARDGDEVVGSLRFYPKWLFSMANAGLCMQQEFPAGPSDRLIEARFPPLDEIEDKTLTVHCLMTGSPFQKENPYQRKGIGTQLARALVDWATANGWEAIEATAYEALNIFYENTGQAGKRFWERLGFKLLRTEVEPALDDESEFVRRARDEAVARGLDVAKIKNRYVMRLELR